jgi:hypothetical protein
LRSVKCFPKAACAHERVDINSEQEFFSVMIKVRIWEHGMGLFRIFDLIWFLPDLNFYPPKKVPPLLIQKFFKIVQKEYQKKRDSALVLKRCVTLVLNDSKNSFRRKIFGGNLLIYELYTFFKSAQN